MSRPAVTEPRYLIGGTWGTESSLPPLPVINPATEERLYDVPCCGAAHVAQALDHAGAALRAWSAVPGWQRARTLRRIGQQITLRREEIARAISTEMGRATAHSLGEVDGGAEQFAWYAGEAERLYGETIPSRTGAALAITPEPVGIVAAFTPWNFPFSLPIRKIAPALAAGCAIILRPSEQTPLVATILAECCLDGGLPDGVLQLLHGLPEPVSEPLMAAAAVRKVSFTGSTRVGRILMAQAAGTLKRLTLELGGHSPVIVCPDTDLDAAARSLTKYKFLNSGQVCASPNRVFLHRDIAEDFTDAFVRHASAVRVGDPMDPETTMGPLTGPAQRDKVERLIADAVQRGAKVRLGGQRSAQHNKGYFFEPTILTDVPDDAALMQEEPFGPIAPLTTYSDLDEAIARANATEYGLAAYAYTGDQSTAQRLSAELQAGMVAINDLMLAHPEAPFTGIKASGMGYASGRMGIREYLNFKTTHMADTIPA